MNPRNLINVTVQASSGGLQPKQIGTPCVFVSHGDVIKTGENGDVPKLEAKTLKAYDSLTTLIEDVGDKTQAYYSAVRWFGNAGGTLYMYFVDDKADSSPQTVVTAFPEAVKLFELIKKDFFVYWCSGEFVDTASNAASIADLAESERFFMATISDEGVAANVTSNRAHFNYALADDITSDGANGYAVGGIAAIASQVDYQGVDTAITLEYKTINGQASSALDKDTRDKLDGAQVSYITNVGADEGVLLNTQTAQKGTYIDDVYNLTALANVMLTNEYNHIRRNPTKVKLTPNGYQQLIDVGSQTCRQFNRNGVLGGGRDASIAGMVLTDADKIQWRDQGYISLSKKEDMLNLPDSNIEGRKFLPINFKVNLARPGHTLDVNIEVI